jgi:acetylornithine deacetylase/succinyl-diaminopimelate desuccinylase-like protein
MNEISGYIENHFAEIRDQLSDLIALKSVSAKRMKLEETADTLRTLMDGMGFETQLLRYGDAPPAIYAHMKGTSDRTVLFYNHYDVQPEEPLDLWDSDPFVLSERDGKWFARGVADDKGDILSRLWAIRALKEGSGALPSSVKFLIEGEEEIGSPNLESCMETYRDLLQADACIWESGSTGPNGNPVIELGVKGMVYVELRAHGANQDVHSAKASVIPSPVWRLVWALESLKGPDERIRIDGFYEDVRTPSELELEAIHSVPAQDVPVKRDLGLDRLLLNVTGTEYTRRLIMEPSINIAGIHAGWTGEGSKTVLPNFAYCKMDIRLVPDQDPSKVLESLKSHLENAGFGDVEVVEMGTLEHPARTPIDHPFVALVRKVSEEVYGEPAFVIPNMSGTGPMYPIVKTLGVPVAGVGINRPGNAMHAPNENVHIEAFKLGTMNLAAILARMGEVSF